MATFDHVDTNLPQTGRLINNPMYSAACRFYGTSRGCRYGMSCRFMHIDQRPPQVMDHETLETMLLGNQLEEKAISGDDTQNEADTDHNDHDSDDDGNESFSSIQGMVSKMTIPVYIPAEVIYSGVFLDENAQESLRKYFCSVSGEELLNSMTDCHVTLSWNPDSDHVDTLPFGSKVKLKAIGICSDSYLQSVVMEIMDPKVARLCAESHSISIPHITVSYNHLVVKPDYSNTLLEEDGYIPISDRSNLDDEKEINDVDQAVGIFEGTVGAYYQEPFYGLHFERIPCTVVHVQQ